MEYEIEFCRKVRSAKSSTKRTQTSVLLIVYEICDIILIIQYFLGILSKGNDNGNNKNYRFV